MAGYLSTHILDTSRGCPAEGMLIELFMQTETGDELVRTLYSNADGRTDELVLSQKEFAFGNFRLNFHAGDYLTRSRAYIDGAEFLDVIPISFKMTRQIHYHVPLLLSPYSYSTYLGS